MHHKGIDICRIYIALPEAVSELKFTRELIKMFDISLVEPIKIYEDNSGAINIANYGSITKNSKHIEIHYLYVHEGVKEKIVNIIKVNHFEIQCFCRKFLV